MFPLGTSLRLRATRLTLVPRRRSVNTLRLSAKDLYSPGVHTRRLLWKGLHPMTPGTLALLPQYLSAADDTPHEVGTEPGWSENYLTHAYDPDTGVGFFLHAGLASFDDRLWNDFFIAFLPGDRFLVANGFAAGVTTHGTEGGQLKLR